MKYHSIIYMNIQDLPTELQNKIFYFSAEHPCAKMIKQDYKDCVDELVQDEDAYDEAYYTDKDCYDELAESNREIYFEQTELSLRNTYFDLVVKKYKELKYYGLRLEEEGNIITNPVLKHFKRKYKKKYKSIMMK